MFLLLQNTKRKAAIAALKQSLATKRATLKKYEKEVEEYEKTKKRKVEPKTYKTKTPTSTSGSDDEATVSWDVLKYTFICRLNGFFRCLGHQR